MVFTGGCVVGLLITDEAAPDVRPTDDVDVIVELVSRREYYQLEDKLRELGFVQKPHENGLLCRWDIDALGIYPVPGFPGFPPRSSIQPFSRPLQIRV
jgi:hypothetical protein